MVINNIFQHNIQMIKNRYQLNLEEDNQQGFYHSPYEAEQILINSIKIEHQQTYNSLQANSLPKKTKLNSSEKHNLKLDSLQNTKVNIITNTFLKRNNALSLIHPRDRDKSINRFDQQNRSLALKNKRTLQQQRSLSKFNDQSQATIFRGRRIQIGENLVLRNSNQLQEQIIKEEMKRPNTTLAYRQKLPNSTHSYFKRLTHHGSSFISNKYNQCLSQKMQKLKWKEQQYKNNNQISFKGDFQSANLDLAFRLAPNQYNLYIKIDTNTKGHQSWFYFKVINHQNCQKRIKINICNLKKKFKMINQGQKLAVKTKGAWYLLQETVEITKLQKKVYKISFSLSLEPNQEKFISLIPPYTYSQLLQEIKQYEISVDCKVQVLTYSVSGLAIPIVTITKDAKKELNDKNICKKKLFLISGRIHPSETCSSYIISALIKQLLYNRSDKNDFLAKTIIKIIPMINPDGVVLGNFRTSYLGDDLNRSFHQSDDALYPEVTAIKELVKLLKDQFQDNFIAFIDMHGHSSKTNSFVYGPQYEQHSEQFMECRILPKILDRISKYFSYEMSSFKLEEYKQNTARGYFLKKMRIPSYTIQTSYALFQDKEVDSCKDMSIEQWLDFGKELSTCLLIYTDYLVSIKKKQAQIAFKQKIKQKKTVDSKREIKNIFNFESGKIINFFDLHKQIQKQRYQRLVKVEIDIKSNISDSDSDGQTPDQDLPYTQKQSLIKKIKQIVQPSLLFPKPIKPTMVLPSIVPSIIIVNRKEYKDINIPKLTNKIKQRKLGKHLNFNSQYTDYLIKNVNNIRELRPDIINFGNLIKKRLKEETQKQKQKYYKIDYS